jgi:hypothetical protein
MVDLVSPDSLQNQGLERPVFGPLPRNTRQQDALSPHSSLYCVPDRPQASATFDRLYPMNLLTCLTAQAAGGLESRYEPNPTRQRRC